MLPILPELERFKEKSMNMQRRISFFIGIALLFTTASFAQQVKTDYDRSTDFSQYKSYSWENVNTQNLLWWGRSNQDGCKFGAGSERLDSG